MILATAAKRENASLGNWVNQPAHVTLTSWIFLKFGGRFHKDMKILKILDSNSKQLRVYSVFKKWQIDDDRGWQRTTTFS